MAEEDRPGAGRVMVISHGLWQRRFGGSPAAVGDAIKLDGLPHTIIGVLRLVFRDGMLATAVGVVAGLAGAAAATRLMGAMLFGVSAWSTLAFAAGPLLLVIGALAGIWLPARRATAIDPLVALREP